MKVTPFLLPVTHMPRKTLKKRTRTSRKFISFNMNSHILCPFVTYVDKRLFSFLFTFLPLHMYVQDTHTHTQIHRQVLTKITESRGKVMHFSIAILLKKLFSCQVEVVVYKSSQGKLILWDIRENL